MSYFYAQGCNQGEDKIVVVADYVNNSGTNNQGVFIKNYDGSFSLVQEYKKENYSHDESRKMRIREQNNSEEPKIWPRRGGCCGR